MLIQHKCNCQALTTLNFTKSKTLPVKPVDLPEIMTTGRSDEAIIADAMRALVQSGRVFVSDGKLCRMINGEIDRLGRWALCYILGQVADWMKRKRDGKIYPCPVPLRICGPILRLGEWPGLPVIKEGGR